MENDLRLLVAALIKEGFSPTRAEVLAIRNRHLLAMPATEAARQIAIEVPKNAVDFAFKPKQ